MWTQRNSWVWDNMVFSFHVTLHYMVWPNLASDTPPCFSTLLQVSQSIHRNLESCHVSQLPVFLGWDSEDAVITVWSGPRLSRFSAESEKHRQLQLCVWERVRRSWRKEADECNKRKRRWREWKRAAVRRARFSLARVKYVQLQLQFAMQPAVSAAVCLHLSL